MSQLRIKFSRKHVAIIFSVMALGAAAIVGVSAAVTPATHLPPATVTRGAGTPAPALQPTQKVNLPAEKQALYDRAATEEASAIAKATAHPRNISAPTGLLPTASAPQPTPITGIRNIGQSPFGKYALIENQWQDIVNGQLVIVYAGRLGAAPDQGFVAVSTGTPSGENVTTQQFLTPTKSGAVKITAVNGSLVTLESTQGVTFTFDLTALTFK